MRRRTYLGGVAASLVSTAGCVAGGGSGPTVDETVETETSHGFAAVAEETIELHVRTISGERTVVDLVDAEGTVLIDDAAVTDERTFVRTAQHTGSHEVVVDPDGRVAVTVHVG